MTDTKPLISYLRDHQLIDTDTADKLAQIDSRSMLVDSLVESGLFSAEDLMRLESLFSAYPSVSKRHTGEVLSQSAIPHELSRQERVVCVSHKGGEVCLVTDKNMVNPDLIDKLFGNDNVRIEKTDSQHIDELLGEYEKNTQSELLSSIERTSSRVRDIERYGSSKMGMFFPQDHKREIAEDLSTRKLIRSLVQLARIKKASSVYLQSQSDKVVVSMRIHGKVHDITVLAKKVETPLVLTLLYLCDEPLNEVTEIISATTLMIDQLPNKKSVDVSISPTVMGYSIELSLDQNDPLFIASSELGMSREDATVLSDLYDRGRGMVIITGREQSGKTFAWYQLLQAAKNIGVVSSLEQSIEYAIDGVNQLVWSKQPLKDVQHVLESSDVVGVRPLNSNHALPLSNAVGRRLIVTETKEGVIGFIKNLISQGLRGGDIAKMCGANIMTVKCKRIDKVHSRIVKLSSDELATLENYISRQEVERILRKEGLIKKAVTLEEMQWVSHEQKVKLWHKIARGVSSSMSDSDNDVYIRVFVDLQDTVELSSRRGESVFELEKSIKEKQKERLVRTLIVRAFRHEIAIKEVVGILRA